MPTSEEWAWFAGLFEGEGSLSRCRPKKGAWRLSLRMTDKDVIQRVASMLGGAMYDNRDRRKATHKQAWSWQEGSQSRINEIVTAIYPLMGARRKAKMDEFREYFAQPVPSLSDRVKRNWENPEYRERMSRERKARWADPEWRARQLERCRAARGRFAAA
jgi:intein/homing endonuclease